MTDRIARFLIAWRYGLFALAIALLAAGWQTADRLQMDRKIEQMFPANDPAVDAYQTLRDRFGGNAVAMLVFPAPDLKTETGIETLDQHARNVEEIPGVTGVLSLAKVDDALKQTQPQRLLGLKGRGAILDEDPLSRGFYELFAGYTHSPDGEFAAIVAMLDPTTPEQHPSAIAEMREIASSFPPQNQPVALVGEPVLISEGFSQVEEDGQLLATVTISLLCLTTLVVFRKFRWVLCQLLVILWAVQTTRAGCVWMGLQLSMVSSMLVAILTVIAVASIIHLAIGYERALQRGHSPYESSLLSLTKILPPVFWACATDAAGFAALTFSNVEPVRDFGLMMAGGSIVVFLGIACIVPAFMAPMPFLRGATAMTVVNASSTTSSNREGTVAHSLRNPNGSRITPVGKFDPKIQLLLVRWAMVLRSHKTAVHCICVIAIGLSLVGLNRLSTETNFIRNFRSTSVLAQSYEMVETKLGGAGVWDILLPAPDVLSREYLASILELETRLRAIQVSDPSSVRDQETVSATLTKVISIADADDVAAGSPLLSLAGPTVRIAGMRTVMPTFVDALVTPEETPRNDRFVRIMLRSQERVSASQKRELISSVQRIVDEHTKSEKWQTLIGDSRPTSGVVTGYYVLLARLIDSILSDQWTCLGIASIAIFLMLWIVTQSFRWALLAMLPNLLPVIIVLGSLGWFQVQMNVGSAMIAAVALGLTIDGSIHFLAAYRNSLRKGSSPRGATLRAQRQTSLPVLIATSALAIGFSALAISSFVPTITFGLLVSAALVVGSFANLTLLPFLLSREPTDSPSPT